MAASSARNAATGLRALCYAAVASMRFAEPDVQGLGSKAGQQLLLQQLRMFGSSPAGSSRGDVAAIKQLRERTGAPMADVKKALVAAEWDLERAFTELRKKGLAAAAKKKSRVSADGVLGLATAAGGRSAVVVEVNSETDFVARNDIFQHLVRNIAEAALRLDTSGLQLEQVEGKEAPNFAACSIPLQALEPATLHLSHSKLSGESSVAEAVAEVAAMMGEHVRLRRAIRLDAEPGLGGSVWGVSSYLHSSYGPGLGRIAGLVSITATPLSSSSSSASSSSSTSSSSLSPPPPEDILDEHVSSRLRDLGSKLAMHAVAARPQFLRRDLVPEAATNHEREILRSQALGSGKPAAVIDKMVEGRLRKYFEEVVFTEQRFVADDSQTVQAMIASAAKDLKLEISLNGFLRMEVGEGVEREAKDFVAEVAAQSGM